MEEAQSQRRMRSIERHQFIIDYLKLHKSVDVLFLSNALHVSEVTIRKDLEKLERDKLLIRSHGGAILNEQLFAEPSFLEKEDQLSDEKEAIASEAAKMIKNGMTIALSTGTTISHLTKIIKDRTGLTVVTNALNVANDLMGLSDSTVFLTGGHIRPNTFALIGETAENALDGVYCEYCFIGTNGLSIEHGLTTPSMEEARVVRKLIENSKHVVLLVDHSKFNKVAFYRIVNVDQIHTIITDRSTPAEELDKLRERGINVIVS
ncbi:DeoR/GlpR family DNA-binding transcription regulator [Paenibacillus ginsengihumi]|jgi:DeoR/GlpR family transcriptional regulator of sugar metabolism|uniref:DeoR/GlpR family DNA-binding transcription regulator n=1 Tax=Paenibacillus ginsengihumi TaxID=431596 RepID=UPI00037EC754|nr:DeoR/GlpR family DNA-binding transcription regulator [Paenibacillus ginsengihumi]